MSTQSLARLADASSRLGGGGTTRRAALASAVAAASSPSVASRSRAADELRRRSRLLSLSSRFHLAFISGHLGPSRSISLSSRAISGHLGQSRFHLGPSRFHLGPSRFHLGPSRAISGHLGPSRAIRGRVSCTVRIRRRVMMTQAGALRYRRVLALLRRGRRGEGGGAGVEPFSAEICRDMMARGWARVGGAPAGRARLRGAAAAGAQRASR